MQFHAVKVVEQRVAISASDIIAACNCHNKAQISENYQERAQDLANIFAKQTYTKAFVDLVSRVIAQHGLEDYGSATVLAISIQHICPQADSPQFISLVNSCLEHPSHCAELPSYLGKLGKLVYRQMDSRFFEAAVTVAAEFLDSPKSLGRFLDLVSRVSCASQLVIDYEKDVAFQLSTACKIVDLNWPHKSTWEDVQKFLGSKHFEKTKELVLAELENSAYTRKGVRVLAAARLLSALNPSEAEVSILRTALFSPSNQRRLYSDNIVNAIRLIGVLRNDSVHPVRQAKFVANQLVALQELPSELAKAIAYYRRNTNKFVAEVEQRGEDILDEVIANPENAAVLFQEIARRPYLVDSTPWHSDSERAHAATIESFEVIAHARDFSRGFGRYTFAARSLPDTDIAALARFGRDVFSACSKLKSGSISDFPGNGWLFKGPELDRIFVSDDLTAITENDPYYAYRAAWPNLSYVFDLFPDTEILVTRGVIAFSNSNTNFDYFGERYSYVIFNDHFDRFEQQNAALVPWFLVEKLIDPCIISRASDFENAKDLSKQGFSWEYLKRECERENLPFLDVAWTSNVGGMCNAFPANSDFIHSWERRLQGQHGNLMHGLDPWRDYWGHLHKALISGYYYEMGLPDRVLQMLVPLQNAHERVYELASDYQALADLFKVSFSLWQKGFCAGRSDSIRLADMVGKTVSSDEVEKAANTLHLRPYFEVLKWHESLKALNSPAKNFPVLAVADTWTLNTKPSGTLYVDTFDLSVIFEPERGPLKKFTLSAEPDEMDQGFWLKHLKPLYESSNLSLAFFHRNQL